MAQQAFIRSSNPQSVNQHFYALLTELPVEFKEEMEQHGIVKNTEIKRCLITQPCSHQHAYSKTRLSWTRI